MQVCFDDFDNSYDIWLRAANFFLGAYKLMQFTSTMCFGVYIYHFYFQKPSVSRREALTLVNRIFKVEFKNADQIIRVNDQQLSNTKLILHPKSPVGKAVFVCCSTFSYSYLGLTVLAGCVYFA